MRISPGWKVNPAISLALCSTSSRRWTVSCTWCTALMIPMSRTPPQPRSAGASIIAMDSELLLNDLIAVDRKMERLAEERKKGGGRDKAVIDREIALFERFKAALEENHPLREVTLSSEEEKTLAGFGFLTRKPMLVVLNLAEGQTPPAVGLQQPPYGRGDPAGKAGNGDLPAATRGCGAVHGGVWDRGTRPEPCDSPVV